MKNTKLSRQLIPLVTTLLLLLAVTANANVIGTDAQNFNSSTSGLDFVTVQSSETLEPGIFNFGFFMNYSKNTLPYFSAGEENDSMLVADVNFGVGLAKNWDAGLSMPYLIDQQVDSDADYGQFVNTGFTEFRLYSKYRLLGDNSKGVAVVGSVNFNNIENNPFTGEEPGPTYNVELAADTTYKKVALAINAGYRFRDPGAPNPLVPEIEPFKDQWIGSLAASYYFVKQNTKLIAEIFGSIPAEKTNLNTFRESTTLEWIAGLKYNINQNVSVHGGGGTELINGSATPDWRVYTGLSWAIGPFFRNKIEQAKEDQNIYKVTKDAEDNVILAEADLFDGPVAEEETFLIKDILFEFNSDVLDPDSNGTIDRLAAYLKRPPELKQIVIEGHTDSIGSNKYNVELSKRRALSVGRYLASRHKIPVKKIRAIGYGETRPIADNGNFQGRMQNRRVEFQIKREKSTSGESEPEFKP